jgi:hypothetical protein
MKRTMNPVAEPLPGTATIAAAIRRMIATLRTLVLSFTAAAGLAVCR